MRVEIKDKFPVEIRNQFLIDPKIPIHFGEIISESEDPMICRGEIGWLDWCNEQGSRPGVSTARLMIVDRRYGIKVDIDHRTSDLNIGTDLFVFQSNRLREFGYKDICILNVTEYALGFYYKAIESLIRATNLSDPTVAVSYEEFTLEGQIIKDKHNLRITFSG